MQGVAQGAAQATADAMLREVEAATEESPKLEILCECPNEQTTLVNTNSCANPMQRAGTLEYATPQAR